MEEIYCLCGAAHVNSLRCFLCCQEFLLQYFGHVRSPVLLQKRDYWCDRPQNRWDQHTRTIERKSVHHLDRAGSWETRENAMSIVFTTCYVLHIKRAFRSSVAHLDIRQVQINKSCSVNVCVCANRATANYEKEWLDDNATKDPIEKWALLAEHHFVTTGQTHCTHDQQMQLNVSLLTFDAVTFRLRIYIEFFASKFWWLVVVSLLFSERTSDSINADPFEPSQQSLLHICLISVACPNRLAVRTVESRCWFKILTLRCDENTRPCAWDRANRCQTYRFLCPFYTSRTSSAVGKTNKKIIKKKK